MYGPVTGECGFEDHLMEAMYRYALEYIEGRYGPAVKFWGEQYGLTEDDVLAIWLDDMNMTGNELHEKMRLARKSGSLA